MFYTYHYTKWSMQNLGVHTIPGRHQQYKADTKRFQNLLECSTWILNSLLLLYAPKMSKGQRVKRNYLQGARPTGSDNPFGPGRGLIRRAVARGRRESSPGQPGRGYPASLRAGLGAQGAGDGFAGPAHCRQVTPAPRCVASHLPRSADWLLQEAPPPQQ